MTTSELEVKKLLISSEEFKDLSGNENVDMNSEINNADSIPYLTRQVSIKSTTSSIDKKDFNEDQAEPIEIKETHFSKNTFRKVFFSYLRANGNIFKILLVLLMAIMTQMIATGGDFWLKYW